MGLVHFAKYEGLGNDFVIIDALGRIDSFLSADHVKSICDRHFGVGADGVLIVLGPRSPQSVAYLRIINADGSTALTCGNGIRCAVKWLYDENRIVKGKQYIIETDSGLRACSIQDNLICVEMGEVSFLGPRKLEGFDASAVAVNVGNSHLVVNLSSSGLTGGCISAPQKMGPQVKPEDDKTEAGDSEVISDQEAQRLGPILQNQFSHETVYNIGFARVKNEREIDLKVWERGVGLTLACGSGACAAVAGLMPFLKLDYSEFVRVNLPGGSLWVSLQDGEKMSVTMKGPAQKVFFGTFERCLNNDHI